MYVLWLPTVPLNECPLTLFNRYDTTNKESLQKVTYWLNDISEYRPDLYVVIVGRNIPI